MGKKMCLKELVVHSDASFFVIVLSAGKIHVSRSLAL